MPSYVMDTEPPAADYRIAYGPLKQQFGELRLPACMGPHPVVLLIHGGWWRTFRTLSHMGFLGAGLAREGIASWSIEYRRLGEDGGGWPGTFDDVAAGAAHLRKLAPEYALDLDRAAAVGFSAGGHLAFWLGAEAAFPWRGVVSLGGVIDLQHAWRLGLGDGATEELLGGAPDQVPERWHWASPMERAPLAVPQRVIHGVEDEVVPIALGREYCRKASGDVRLIELVGCGHLDPLEPDGVHWPVVLDVIRSVLG